MESIKKLRSAVFAQRSTLDEIERLTGELESLDLTRELDSVKQQNEELTKSLEKARAEALSMREQASRLRSQLTEQIAGERTYLLKLSRRRIDALFDSATSSGENSLSMMESRHLRELEGLKSTCGTSLREEDSRLTEEINALAKRVRERVCARREALEADRKRTLAMRDEDYRALESATVDDATVEKRVRQNRAEIKVGLNLVNKIGVLLILLGLGASVQYGYAHFFNEWTKGSFAFLLGLILLCVGEISARKGLTVFASGLTGGGIAGLYGALFYSHFILHIVGLDTALVISLLVAVVSIALTLRYDSQTISVISLVGGFLPFFSYSFGFEFGRTETIIAFAYIMVLNATLVAISCSKSWRVTTWVSFLVGAPCVVYLASSVDSVSLGVTFILASFTMYQVSVLLKPIRHKIEPAPSDIAIMSLNSLLASLVVFGLFEQAGMSSWYGLLAVFFSALFIAQGFAMARLYSMRSIATAILFGCALTFSVLAFPFQFGVRWALLGWACEGAFLSVVGSKYRSRYVEVAGWVILVVSTIVFCAGNLGDLMDGHFADGVTVQFASLLAAVTAVAYYHGRYLPSPDSRSSYGISRAFAWSSAAMAWVFVLSVIPHWVGLAIAQYDIRSPELFDLFGLLSLSIAHLLLGVWIRRYPPLEDRYLRHATLFFYIIAGLYVLALNTTVRVLPSGEGIGALHLIAFIILVAYNIAYVLVLRSVILTVLKESMKSLEIYPAAIALWLLSVLVSGLIVQFDLGVESMAFTTALVLYSLCAVIYGFIRRYSVIRVSGLALVVITLAKFFVFDLSHLILEFRILAFFGYGIILLAISFIYQRMKIAMDGTVPHGRE